MLLASIKYARNINNVDHGAILAVMALFLVHKHVQTMHIECFLEVSGNLDVSVACAPEQD